MARKIIINNPVIQELRVSSKRKEKKSPRRLLGTRSSAVGTRRRSRKQPRNAPTPVENRQRLRSRANTNRDPYQTKTNTRRSGAEANKKRLRRASRAEMEQMDDDEGKEVLFLTFRISLWREEAALFARSCKATRLNRNCIFDADRRSEQQPEVLTSILPYRQLAYGNCPSFFLLS